MDGGFIGERVEVSLPRGHFPRRDPPAPASFEWRGRRYTVRGVLGEWWDYSHRTPAQRTYRPNPHRLASRQGSFGRGRHYFRVETDGGVFLIYYDRRPAHGRREGSWVLYQQVEGVEDS